MSESVLPRRVVVTRSPEQAGALAKQLEAHGAEPVFFPTLQLLARTGDELDCAVQALDEYACLLLGSVHAVDGVGTALEKHDLTCALTIGCVGKKTAQHLRSSRWATTFTGRCLIPESFRAEALADLVAAHLESTGGIEGRRVLFARAPDGRTVLQACLRARGAVVTEVEAYRMVCRPKASAEIEVLNHVDAVTFLSGKTLACFLSSVGESQARRILEKTTVAMIGPVARAEAERLGIRVDVVPEEATSEALVEALMRKISSP